ncbi:bifunctional oligoribonuclease/PAP phosphatase NrnA [Chlamydiota bacterium]
MMKNKHPHKPVPSKKKDLESSIQEFHCFLNQYQLILVTGHRAPDGDSIATQLALGMILNDLGKTVLIWGEESIPDNFSFLKGKELWQSNKAFLQNDGVLCIVVDSPDIERVPSSLNEYVKKTNALVTIDHHISHTYYGNINIVDIQASSCGEMLYDIFISPDTHFSLDIAECFYTSILTDTGGFRYRNTTPKALRIAAKLVEQGVLVEKVYNNVYGKVTVAKMKLFSSALDTLFSSFDGKVIGIEITREMFDRCKAGSKDVDGFIDSLRLVGGVKIALLFFEADSGVIKVGFRSNDLRFDVNVIAQQFGGGGHPTASGARIAGTLEGVKKVVLRAISAQFNL